MNLKAFIENIIKEEIQSLKEDDVEPIPGGNWGQPIPGLDDEPQPTEAPADINNVADQVLGLLSSIEHNDAVDILNAVAVELGLVEPESESRPIGFRIDESVIKKLREAKGLATARVAQHGHDTVDSGMDDAHRAVVDAGGYKSSGMMGFMRTLAQTSEGAGLTPEETLDLARQMLDAGFLLSAETDRTGSLEENESPADPPLEGESRQLSVDELKAEIINMWNDMHGKESFTLGHLANWDEQSLHALHDTTDREHRDWHNQERVEDDLDDINYEKEMRNASQHDAQTSLDRLDAIEAETERMREPEEGEEFAKHGGMGRGPREAKSWSSYGDAKTLFEGWRKFTKE